MSAQTINTIVGGRLVAGDPATGFTDVFTDTRKPVAGGLFVALSGPTFDGHDFVAAAVAAGARGVVVSDSVEVDEGVVVIEVDDTLRALQRLAGDVRARHPGVVVAITGSVGKTTVKDMVADALSAFGTVARTPGNYNNHIGLPLTLLATTGDEDFVVLELGMSAPGEIAALTRLARPQVGLVTTATAAHLEFFDSVDAIADAKAELYATMNGDSRAVANADDPRMLTRARQHSGPGVITFGHAEDAQIRLADTTLDATGLSARIDVAGVPVDVRLSALGAHNAHNASAALAVVAALGLDPASAARALGERFSPGNHRLVLARGSAGMTVLDDCYNANPASTRAALLTLRAIAPEGAITGAVLGSMLELGDNAAALHAEIGAEAVRAGLSWLAATGPHAEDVAQGARAAGLDTVLTADDASQLTQAVADFAGPGRWLLLKGSRGQRLERLLGPAGIDDASGAHIGGSA